MIGVKIVIKHALIYKGKEEAKYKFFNNRRKDSLESEHYIYTAQELLDRLDDQVAIAYIEPIEKVIPLDNKHEMILSLKYLEEYKDIVMEFCYKEQEFSVLQDAQSRLFAAFLLHVSSMMDIIGEVELANEIVEIRTEYMNAMRQQKSMKLADFIHMNKFESIITKYIDIINKKLECM